MLRRPDFHDPSEEDADTVCGVTAGLGHHCLTHDRPWAHGGAHCPDHGHHEIASFCDGHGLECVPPQPSMLRRPSGFDPRLSATQFVAAEAGVGTTG